MGQEEFIKIVKLQQRYNLLKFSDAELARHLGISPTLWCRLQRGERKITVDVLRKIIRQFPSLQGAVLEFLQE